MKKRPTFLTVWLVILTIVGALGVLGIFAMSTAYPNAPSWAITVLSIAAVVDFLAIIMLWMWKKMGFYLTAAMTAISSMVGLTISSGTNDLIWVVVSAVGIGILYLAMKPVWNEFK